MKWLVAILAVLALLAIAFFLIGGPRVWAMLAGPADLGRYDFATGARSTTANDALACSPGACVGDPDIVLPEYEQQPAALIARLEERIRELDPHARRAGNGSDPAYMRVLTWSPALGFPDTTDIEAVTLDDGKTGLRLYARAKLGSRDFGANRERLELWLEPFMQGSND